MVGVEEGGRTRKGKDVTWRRSGWGWNSHSSNYSTAKEQWLANLIPQMCACFRDWQCWSKLVTSRVQEVTRRIRGLEMKKQVLTRDGLAASKNGNGII